MTITNLKENEVKILKQLVGTATFKVGENKYVEHDNQNLIDLQEEGVIHCDGISGGIEPGIFTTKVEWQDWMFIAQETVQSIFRGLGLNLVDLIRHNGKALENETRESIEVLITKGYIESNGDRGAFTVRTIRWAMQESAKKPIRFASGISLWWE